MRSDLRIAAFLLVAVALVGCPGTLDEEKFKNAGTCTDPVTDVFQVTCAIAGCHTTVDSSEAGELDLQAPNIVQRLRGKKAHGGAGYIIDPSNPEQSLLITKLKSPVPFGSRMPLGFPTLDSVHQKCIHDWVVANANPSMPDGGTDGSVESGADSATDDAADASATDSAGD